MLIVYISNLLLICFTYLLSQKKKNKNPAKEKGQKEKAKKAKKGGKKSFLDWLDDSAKSDGEGDDDDSEVSSGDEHCLPDTSPTEPRAMVTRLTHSHYVWEPFRSSNPVQLYKAQPNPIRQVFRITDGGKLSCAVYILECYKVVSISDFYYDDKSEERNKYVGSIIREMQIEYCQYDIITCEAAIDGEVSMAPYLDTVGPYYLDDLVRTYATKCAADDDYDEVSEHKDARVALRMLYNAKYIGWHTVVDMDSPGDVQPEIVERICREFHNYRIEDEIRNVNTDEVVRRNKGEDSYWKWNNRAYKMIDDVILYDTCVRVITTNPYRAIIYVSAPFLPLCTLHVNKNNVYIEHIKFSGDKSNKKRLTKRQCKTVLASIISEVVACEVASSNIIIFGRNYYNYDTRQEVEFMLCEEYAKVANSERTLYSYSCSHNAAPMVRNINSVGGYEVEKQWIQLVGRKKKALEEANIIKPIIIRTDVQDKVAYPSTGACALYAYIDIVRNFSPGIIFILFLPNNFH